MNPNWLTEATTETMQSWAQLYYNRPSMAGAIYADIGQRAAQHSDHTHIHMQHSNCTSGIDFNTTTRESTMDRTAVIAAEIARLQEELATRARFGEDHEDGTILSFEGHYDSNGHTYNYAAIRAGGKWHVTGSRSNSNLTWSQLVDFLNRVNTTNLRKRGKGKVIAE